MKKLLLSIAAASLMVALSVPAAKSIYQAKADSDYVVYKNADLGLEDYGDVFTYDKVSLDE